ncbi:lipopolysaccharide kinase InaA family protein [Gilvimarinus sp. F26214L]|uniref:lipopolysaccharide kinase InaA family protein n=1 Tax=Gilvimarinus sp. DZF01 TaxID=3461371 RepID=UPI0040460D1C
MQQSTGENWEQVAATLASGSLPAGWQRLVSSAQAGVFFARDRAIYLKLFHESRPHKKLRSWLAPGYARHRQFVRNSELLLRLGFRAPPVLASGKVHGAARHSCGFVVSEAFEGMGLGSFLARYLTASREDERLRRWKRWVMRELGAEVARLHNAGIAHGDLRPDNILLSCISPIPQFCFIDNERNHRHQFGISRRAREKNLSQLNMLWSEDLSAPYRMRFIRSYLSHSAQDLDGKALMRRVSAISTRRLRGKPRGGYRQGDQRQMTQPDFDRLLAKV